MLALRQWCRVLGEDVSVENPNDIRVLGVTRDIPENAVPITPRIVLKIPWKMERIAPRAAVIVLKIPAKRLPIESMREGMLIDYGVALCMMKQWMILCCKKLLSSTLFGFICQFYEESAIVA